MGAGQTSGKHLPQSGAGQTSDLHLPLMTAVVHVKRPTSRSYKDAGQIIFKTAFCCCFSGSVLNHYFYEFYLSLPGGTHSAELETDFLKVKFFRFLKL